MVDLSNKSIVLWGIGDYGRKFIKDNADRFDIKYIVDSKVKSEEIYEYNGNKYTIKNPAFLEKGKDFVIICIKAWQFSVKQELEKMGFGFMNDYLPYSYFDENSIDVELYPYINFDEYVEERRGIRKVAGFYGTCHMEVYQDTLKRNSEFSKNYVVLDMPSINELNSPAHDLLKDKQIWSLCDCVVANRILGLNSYDVLDTYTILDYANPSNSITITPAFFEGYFPQGSRSNSEKVRPYFTWVDKNLDKMISRNCTTDEMIKALYDEEFYSEDKVNDFYDISLEKLLKVEKDCDITVGDYILKEGKNTLLFESWTHPTTTLFNELILRLMEKINTCGNMDIQFSLKLHEQPVYMSVAKALGLDLDEIRTRKVNPGDQKSAYSLEEYAINYYEKKQFRG